VLRTFEDADVTHVEDRVDPVEDMKIIHAELRAKDLERVGKIIDVRPGAGRSNKGVPVLGAHACTGRASREREWVRPLRKCAL
jgi:hypothetical protein